MRLKIFILSFLLLVLSMNFISAEIMFSQTDRVYSIGDFIDVDATIKASSDISGFLRIYLSCRSEIRDFYLSPIFLSAGEQEFVQKKLLLSRAFLRGLTGECKLEGDYGSEHYLSQVFQVSDKAELNVTASPLSANPGEKISVAGTAVKSNAKNLEGFAEIRADSINASITVPVSQGGFNADLSVPGNARSGNYNLFVKVYDKSGNDTGNYDEKSIMITINQVPTKIEIIIDNQNVNPNEKIGIIPRIYDQAEEEITGTVKISVKDSNGNLYLEKELGTNERFELGFLSNSTPGYWAINASSLGINGEREIYIKEYEKAQFTLISNTLTIKNIGNTAYKKIISVKIGDETKSKEVNLGVGESSRYRISAPDGVYEVIVNDGTEENKFGNVMLTGSAISIEDIRDMNILKEYPIVWLFLIIIFGLFAVMTAGNIRRRKFYGHMDSGSPVKNYENVTIKIPEIKSENQGKNENPVIHEYIKNAEHSASINGKREEASILAIKIKNSGAMNNKIVKESMEKARGMITRHKGSLYSAGDSIIGIFTPSVTKTFRNDFSAVKAATEIASSLNEHNRKFNEKIDFGIGIHSGEIAAGVDKGKLKFTALGNSMNMAKKMASEAKNDVFLSKKSSSRLASEVKTDKAGEYYSIKRVVDRELHKDFINNFLNRN